jgi:hypothetical protein
VKFFLHSFSFFLLISLPTQASTVKTMCGWLDNPTPQNMDFVDGNATWTISQQGSKEAKGLPLKVNFGKEFVTTQASYGYGCACIEAITDSATMKVVEIKSIKEKKLSDCRNDKSLKGKFPPEATAPLDKNDSIDKAFLGSWKAINEDCAPSSNVMITTKVIRIEGEEEKEYKFVKKVGSKTWVEILNLPKKIEKEKFYQLKILSKNTIELHTANEITSEEQLGGLTCVLKK